MSKKREYDEKYKVQAVKLAKTSDQQKQQSWTSDAANAARKKH